MSSKNAFTDISRIIFDRTSGHQGAGKLTHKINHHIYVKLCPLLLNPFMSLRNLEHLRKHACLIITTTLSAQSFDLCHAPKRHAINCVWEDVYTYIKKK